MSISPVHHRRDAEAAGGFRGCSANIVESFGRHGVQRICTNSGRCQSALITAMKGGVYQSRRGRTDGVIMKQLAIDDEFQLDTAAMLSR